MTEEEGGEDLTISKDKYVRFAVQAKLDISAYDRFTGNNYSLSVVRTLNTSSLMKLLSILSETGNRLDSISEKLPIPKGGESDA